MKDFPLRWRFTERKYRLLPSADLERIKPLEPASARQLLALCSQWLPLPPCEERGFKRIENVSIDARDADEARCVQQWLRLKGVPLSQEVVALWDSHTAALTTWEMIANYWNVFWYPSSDDLTVFDASRSWVLFLSHEEVAFFASFPDALASESQQLNG